MKLEIKFDDAFKEILTIFNYFDEGHHTKFETSKNRIPISETLIYLTKMSQDVKMNPKDTFAIQTILDQCKHCIVSDLDACGEKVPDMMINLVKDISLEKVKDMLSLITEIKAYQIGEKVFDLGATHWENYTINLDNLAENMFELLNYNYLKENTMYLIFNLLDLCLLLREQYSQIISKIKRILVDLKNRIKEHSEIIESIINKSDSLKDYASDLNKRANLGMEIIREPKFNRDRDKVFHNLKVLEYGLGSFLDYSNIKHKEKIHLKYISILWRIYKQETSPITDLKPYYNSKFEEERLLKIVKNTVESIDKKISKEYALPLIYIEELREALTRGKKIRKLFQEIYSVKLWCPNCEDFSESFLIYQDKPLFKKIKRSISYVILATGLIGFAGGVLSKCLIFLRKSINNEVITINDISSAIKTIKISELKQKLDNFSNTFKENQINYQLTKFVRNLEQYQDTKTDYIDPLVLYELLADEFRYSMSDKEFQNFVDKIQEQDFYKKEWKKDISGFYTHRNCKISI